MDFSELFIVCCGLVSATMIERSPEKSEWDVVSYLVFVFYANLKMSCV